MRLRKISRCDSTYFFLCLFIFCLSSQVSAPPPSALPALEPALIKTIGITAFKASYSSPSRRFSHPAHTVSFCQGLRASSYSGVVPSLCLSIFIKILRSVSLNLSRVFIFCLSLSLRGGRPPRCFNQSILLLLQVLLRSCSTSSQHFFFSGFSLRGFFDLLAFSAVRLTPP